MQSNNGEQQERATLLVQQAREALGSTAGDRMDNIERAIDLYRQALPLVNPASEDAADIRSRLARAIAEETWLAVTQVLSTQNIPANTRQTLSTLAERFTSLAQTEADLAQQSSQAANTMQIQIRDIEEKKKDLEEEKEILEEEKKDLEVKKKEVGFLLNLKNALGWMLGLLVRGLAWLLKPVVYPSLVVALIIMLAALLLSNWHFNHNPFQLCSSDTNAITISASPLLQPLLQAEEQKYRQSCSNAPIQVTTASPDGITQVDTNSAVTIGAAETFAYTTQHSLWDDQIAITVFAMVVNPKVGLSVLTTENIREIYSGSVANWKDVCHLVNQKQVCGNNLGINIIGRPADSDVRAVFEQYVLGSAEYIPGSTISDVDSIPRGNGIIQDVMNTSGAIGYVTLSTAQQAHVTPVSIDGVAPTLTSVVNETYNFWTIEHLYTRERATGLAQSFIYFMHTDDAIALLRQDGFLSITDVPAKVLSDHTGL